MADNSTAHTLIHSYTHTADNAVNHTVYNATAHTTDNASKLYYKLFKMIGADNEYQRERVSCSWDKLYY